jgi:RTX calcium-binding nonapeptide repeat (4 copies)/Putative peptidoglycan binding domain/Effector-associated domain 1
MKLTDSVFAAISAALLDAFSEYENFEPVARCLGAELEHIVATGTLQEVVDNLIEYAATRDKIEELIDCCKRTNTSNMKLAGLDFASLQGVPYNEKGVAATRGPKPEESLVHPHPRRIPRAVWIGGLGLVGLVIVGIVLRSVLGGGGVGPNPTDSTIPVVEPSVATSPSIPTLSGLGSRELREGTQGADVQELESKLKAYGFDPGLVDGTFDSLTKNAVGGFQACAVGTKTYVVDLATAVALVRGPTNSDMTPGDDQITGTPGPDILFGGDGDDTIQGVDGDDIICGGNGNDILIGGAGRDRVTGAAGDDQIEGGAGSDILGGGSGNDRVDGGGCCDAAASDSDEIHGGPGDDALYAADAGTATILGEEGTDRCPASSIYVHVDETCEETL